MAEPFAAGLRWLVLLDGEADGATNMARDHALALTLPAGQAVLRLYGWSAPTLSFGRNEPAVGLWDRAGLRADGVGVVRRPTGGRAVLHRREVTYAVVAPLPDRGALRAAYRRINEAIVRGLHGLGVAAELALEGSIAHLDAGPCFAGPAPDEIVAGGRKLVGSAQARLEGRLLQHGSLLLGDDQWLAAGHRLRAVDRRSGRAVAPASGQGDERAGVGPLARREAAAARAPATLTALLGRTPAPAEVAVALCRGFEAELTGAWPGIAEVGWPHGRGEDTLPGATRAHERTLRERYVSESWTWRR